MPEEDWRQQKRTDRECGDRTEMPEEDRRQQKMTRIEGRKRTDMPEEDWRHQKMTGREGGERTDMPEEDRRQQKGLTENVETGLTSQKKTQASRERTGSIRHWRQD
jgi:hypothetical protein